LFPPSAKKPLLIGMLNSSEENHCIFPGGSSKPTCREKMSAVSLSKSGDEILDEQIDQYQGSIPGFA
jgi:hypothetical protein